MLTHKGTQILQTDRLTLRPFTLTDAQQMYDNWATDEKVTHYMTWPPHQSPAFTGQLLEKWCAAYETLTTYNWLIEFEGHAIGNVEVVRLKDKDEYAELGYCMGSAYWNQGIMTEAVKAVIDFLFAEVGLHRIEINHATNNPGSGRVAQKCGLTYEGTKRDYFRDRYGMFRDIACYSILRQEWKK